jgi:GntR family transcriptional regulator
MSNTPYYQQVMQTIVKRIEDGEYLPNEKLPSERKLSEIYDLNRATIKKAFDKLQEQGYIIRKGNKGSFVSPGKNRLLFGLGGRGTNSGISARVKATGMQPGSKTILADFIEGYTSMNKRLRLGPKETLFSLHRIRYGDDMPLAIEYSYVPAYLFDDIAQQDFEHVSLYDYMDSKGHLPVEFSQQLMIVNCPKRERKLLKLQEGVNDIVFYFEYTGRDRRGQVVEFTRSYLIADKIDFKFYTYCRNFGPYSK